MNSLQAKTILDEPLAYAQNTIPAIRVFLDALRTRALWNLADCDGYRFLDRGRLGSASGGRGNGYPVLSSRTDLRIRLEVARPGPLAYTKRERAIPFASLSRKRFAKWRCTVAVKRCNRCHRIGNQCQREARLRPIKIDILRGIVGFRIFVIRAADQERIAQMDEQALRKQLIFGLNSQWADLPVMRANGFSVETATSYENLFVMLAGGRFDAFPRGLNEASRELEERRKTYPQLAVERTRRFFSTSRSTSGLQQGKHGSGATDRARTEAGAGRRIIPQTVRKLSRDRNSDAGQGKTPGDTPRQSGSALRKRRNLTPAGGGISDFHNLGTP